MLNIPMDTWILCMVSQVFLVSFFLLPLTPWIYQKVHQRRLIKAIGISLDPFPVASQVFQVVVYGDFGKGCLLPRSLIAKTTEK